MAAIALKYLPYSAYSTLFSESENASRPTTSFSSSEKPWQTNYQVNYGDLKESLIPKSFSNGGITKTESFTRGESSFTFKEPSFRSSTGFLLEEPKSFILPTTDSFKKVFNLSWTKLSDNSTISPIYCPYTGNVPGSRVKGSAKIDSEAKSISEIESSIRNISVKEIPFEGIQTQNYIFLDFWYKSSTPFSTTINYYLTNSFVSSETLEVTREWKRFSKRISFNSAYKLYYYIKFNLEDNQSLDISPIWTYWSNEETSSEFPSTSIYLFENWIKNKASDIFKTTDTYFDGNEERTVTRSMSPEEIEAYCSEYLACKLAEKSGYLNLYKNVYNTTTSEANITKDILKKMTDLSTIGACLTLDSSELKLALEKTLSHNKYVKFISDITDSTNISTADSKLKSTYVEIKTTPKKQSILNTSFMKEAFEELK